VGCSVTRRYEPPSPARVNVWESGDLIACVAVVRCDRCDTLGPCVQLTTHGDQINVCLKQCFLELAYALGKYAGDALRQAMGKGLRGDSR
jgi:hypothetical protein